MTIDDAESAFDKAAPPVDNRALANCGQDDLGNSERLRERFGHDLRYTGGLGVHVFDGKRWKLDAQQHSALRAAHKTVRAIVLESKALLAEARECDDPEQKKALTEHAEALRKWATTSANGNHLKAVLTHSWPYLTHPLEGWNAEPTLFNAQNGTLDLFSIEPQLRAHRREDYLTHMANVAYDPDAQCREFRKFIDRVLPPETMPEGVEDRSYQKFVQRCLGACLIDSVKDQALVVFHGGGANGKSTLMNAVANVLGDYAMTVAVQSLLYSEQSGSSASPDVARLAERPRLVRVSEPEPGAKLSEGGVKSLTGGEPLVARKLHQEPIEFSPNFKIFLSCNNRPSIRGGDDGIWRRILLVAWRVQIPPEEQREKGPALEVALREEAPGILNWLVEGLQDYYECGGLAPPPSVLSETLEYRTDSDVVGRFIGECCDRGDLLEEDAGDLYEAFKLWAKEQGLSPKGPMTPTTFGKRLTDRGYSRRRSNGATFRQGLELDSEWRAKLKEERRRTENATADRESRRRGADLQDEE